MTFTALTLPNFSNVLRSAPSVTSVDRFPMYIVVILFSLKRFFQRNGWLGTGDLVFSEIIIRIWLIVWFIVAQIDIFLGS